MISEPDDKPSEETPDDDPNDVAMRDGIGDAGGAGIDAMLGM
jgi:hypothetical protein